MSGNVIEVTSEDFDEEVMNDSDAVMVDFWEPSCGSCLALAPMYESLAKEFKGQLKFVKVNTEDNPDIAERFEISGLPTFLIFKEGEQVDEFEGDELPSKSQLREMISKYVSSDDEESSEPEQIPLDRKTYKKLKSLAKENETSVNEEIASALTNYYDDIEDEDLEEIDVITEDDQVFIVLPENIYTLIDEEAESNSSDVSDELNSIINEYLSEDEEEEEDDEESEEDDEDEE